MEQWWGIWIFDMGKAMEKLKGLTFLESFGGQKGYCWNQWRKIRPSQWVKLTLDEDAVLHGTCYTSTGTVFCPTVSARAFFLDIENPSTFAKNIDFLSKCTSKDDIVGVYGDVGWKDTRRAMGGISYLKPEITTCFFSVKTSAFPCISSEITSHF